MSSNNNGDDEYLIEVNDASFKYVPRDVEERGATFTEGEDKGFQLKNVSLKVKRGEKILLVGTNGSGKSTLFSLVAGKRKAASGNITVLGRDAFDDTSLQNDVCLIGEPWPAEALFSCSVEAVVTPSPDVPRRDELARRFHLPMKASLNKMSSGQKRRVQILHGMMAKRQVMLLDESATDLDVAERITLLNFVSDECAKHGAACIYATHILDGVQDWATRIIMMNKGQIVKDEQLTPSNTTAASSSSSPSSSLDHSSLALEKRVTSWFLELNPTLAHLSSSSGDGTQLTINSAIFKSPKKNTPSTSTTTETLPAKDMIVFNNFSFRDLYENVNHKIPVGKRIVLSSCNGAGKSTVLSLLAGHTFFPNKNNALTIDGRPCFQDTKAQEIISFGGNWWTRTPGGEMHVREMLPLPLDDRAESLRKLLAVNLDWDVRHVSTGELKRIQLLLKMVKFTDVILADEATADLDIHMRAALMHFLYDESEKRGVTVIYCTHIFEGLGDWPTDVIFVDRSQRGFIHHKVVQEEEDNNDEMVVGEKLRKFIIKTLLELKAKERWEEWYV